MPVKQRLPDRMIRLFTRTSRSDSKTPFVDRQSLEALTRTLDIFSRLNDRQIKRVARLLIPRQYAKGDLVIRKGDLGLGMFILTSGRLKVFDDQNGSERQLGILESGQIVGEMSLIDTQPRSMNVKALEETECLLITRDSFEGLVKRQPEVLWGIVPILVERLRRLSEQEASTQHDISIADRPVNGAPPQLTVEPEETEPADESVDAGRHQAFENDLEPESPADNQRTGLISACFQLVSASLMLSSSIGLLGTQEILRVMVGKGNVSRRLDESENVVSSIASTAEEQMDPSCQRLFNSFRELMGSLLSAFEK